MENKTEFYNLLKKAETDDQSLLIVINMIKGLIIKNSKVEDYQTGLFVKDIDLESTLISAVVKLIKYDHLADKLANGKI